MTFDKEYKIDQQTGTTFWKNQLKSRWLTSVSLWGFKGVTPEQMREGKVQPGFKYVGTHVIFDIKMGGKFTCKARLVAGRNITAPPSLYGMKLSGEACRNKLSKILNSMGYRSADYYHGYWIKRATT